MLVKEAPYIWHNGDVIRWQDAKVHVLSHALHYGTSVFEGIRAYHTPKGPAIFRLSDHMKRFFESAKVYRFNVPFSQQELEKACIDMVDQNELKSAYIRPVAFLGYGHVGLLPPMDLELDVSVIAFEWGSYLGESTLEHGVDVCVSSWNRIAPNTVPAMAKAGGNYLPSRLICMDAKRNGYHEAIALDTQGFVSEGPGENIFLIRDGVIYTPPLHHSVLAGITRDSVIKMANKYGYEVQEKTIPREMLYLADELFFTGTAAEVVPIRSVDKLEIGDGKPGPITKQIQRGFFGLFTGETEDEWGWLEHTPRHEDSLLLI